MTTKKKNNLNSKRYREIRLIHISKKPNLLPFQMEWSDLNSKQSKLLNEAFFFLEKNYIEDDDSFFRLNYPQEFIKLALQTPDWGDFFNICLKFRRNRCLLGFIASLPCKINVENYFFPTSEINFLCLERGIRKKGFVQNLIGEETRRLNCLGIIQATYTTGLSFAEYMSVGQYFHFPLNHSVLEKFGFGDKIENIKNIFSPSVQGINNLNSNPNQIYQTARSFFSRLKIYKFLDLKNFFYWFKSVPGVTYRIECEGLYEKNIPLLLYSLPSKILKKSNLDFLFPIYLFQIYTKNPEGSFLEKISNFSFRLGFDIFNVLEGVLKKKFLLTSKFQKGTGKLQFHIFNWKYHKINPEENGLVIF